MFYRVNVGIVVGIYVYNEKLISPKCIQYTIFKKLKSNNLIQAGFKALYNRYFTN